MGVIDVVVVVVRVVANQGLDRVFFRDKSMGEVLILLLLLLHFLLLVRLLEAVELLLMSRSEDDGPLQIGDLKVLILLVEESNDWRLGVNFCGCCCTCARGSFSSSCTIIIPSSLSKIGRK
jgi:hypothetical protein